MIMTSCFILAHLAGCSEHHYKNFIMTPFKRIMKKHEQEEKISDPQHNIVTKERYSILPFEKFRPWMPFFVVE